MPDRKRNTIFLGSTRADLRSFPAEVRQVMGFALYAAELGKKHDSAKPLTGNDKLRGVVEIVDDYDGDTYRCAYSAKLGNTVYVLHAFQKKSKHGIATPKRDLAIIEQRLKEAKQLHQEQEKERKKK